MVRDILPVLIAFFWFSAPAAPKKFDLTIENIMRGPNLVGTEPAQVRWSGDSSRIYFQWKRASDAASAPPDTYVVNCDGSGLRKLSDEEKRWAPPPSADTNKDRTLSVFSQEGDLFLIDHTTGKGRQLTKTAEEETNSRFLPDGRRIAFQRGSNLFVLSLDTGELEQMTEIRPASAPSEPKKETGSQEYLKKEQTEFFEAVRDRDKLKKENEARQKRFHPRKPYTLQARQSVTQLQLSPEGKYVLAIVSEPAANTKSDNVPNWITDSSYPEEISSRPRVGDDFTQRHLVILDAATGEAKTVDHGAIGVATADIEDGGGCGGRSGFTPGSAPPQTVLFSHDGSKAVFSARARDNKSCWIFALDTAGAKARVLFKDEDKAWLGGPGGGQGWLGDNHTFYFTSERDGFNHLYEVPYEGGAPKQITAGRFEVDKVELSSDQSRFYLTTSEGSFFERHLWSMPVGGGPGTRMTKLPGLHATAISPDEKWIADVYSYTNKPPELYLQPNQPVAAAAQVTDSPAPEFHSYPWLDTPIVEIPARDGTEVPGHFYKPARYGRGGPAVIFVHGAGYLQNVHKGWSSSYYHEYLFHHFLREHGYLVLDIDYRGSKGYGRDWRTAIYRHMGGIDLTDQVDAAQWLVSQQGADPKRIGIYGGSYGGFITLMAMFTQPDAFAAGAALRPVSDWALYNQGYTSNILDLPQKDPEAYKQSSPIFFANGLKGALLICHGMVDTNVHFIDTVRLTQRLIELHKDDWELAVYPVEDHGFKEASSWTDEYKRIYKLFESKLKK
jgi:dipeptidyl aminopeptidase/acylaminoacyl peptidase